MALVASLGLLHPQIVSLEAGPFKGGRSIRRRQQEEAERKAQREKRLQERRERREELFQTAKQWRRSQILREFIEAVRATAAERAEGKKLHPDTMRWLDWAMKTANRADPIEQMKEDSDRHKRPRKPK